MSPTQRPADQSRLIPLKGYSLAFAVFWSVVVGASFLWNMGRERQAIHALVRSQAQNILDKDLLYRRWAAGHGGVYVPVTTETPPNPLLDHIAERDIATASGRRLTLVNPAYMSRQVYELAAEQESVHGHITSLKPIRPENAPDPWEAEALQAFQSGHPEISAIEILKGKSYFRLMRPMLTEEHCLKCHAEQGYRVGDIRGGISISVPMAPFEAMTGAHAITIGLGHAFLWLLGLGGMYIGTRHIGGRVRERDQAERALRRSEEKYRSLFDTSRDGIVIVGLDGRIEDANQAYLDMLGYELEEVRALTYQEIIPSKWASMNTDIVENQVMKRGYSDEFEKEYLRRDGMVVPVRLRAWLVRDDQGRPLRLLGLARDITEQKRTEEELRQSKVAADAANQAKSEFLANMSHEIRTPMSGVLGMLHLLEDADLTQEQRNHLDMACKSARSLLGVVDDILDFSRIEAGQLVFEMSEVSVGALVERAADLCVFDAQRNGLKLSTRLHPDLPQLLVGDPQRLQQVLVNLIGNAIKFTPEGEVTVTARPAADEPAPANGITLEFSVRDTGIGVAASETRRLFESFSQGDSSSTRRYEGSGLGLSICKGIVERMGGRIWVESEQGKGSTFSFTACFALPTSSSAESAPAGEQCDTWAAAQVNGLRILVAEDNPVNQIFVRAILEQQGWAVEVAGTGSEALEAWRTGAFHLVLMDVQMPEMDGYEVTRTIRRQSPRSAARIPIIGLTAHAMEGDRDKCLGAGMDDYLAKPVDADELCAAVKRALRRGH